jgi:hypothetical protein
MSSPKTPVQRPLQFRLSYLIYLLTVFAVGCALLRQILLFRGGWAMTAAGAAYLAFWIGYLAIRVPILYRRLRHTNRSLDARREELAEWAANRHSQQSKARDSE